MPSSSYQLVHLDLVDGAAVTRAINRGSYTRMALVRNNGLPLAVPTPYELIKLLDDGALPWFGDALDGAEFKEWFLKGFDIKPQTAVLYSVTLTYLYRRDFSVRDTSSVQMVKSQLMPTTFEPFYIQNPGTGGPTKRVVNVSIPLPVRHLIVKGTLPYEAAPDVAAGLGGVNDDVWQGYPKGYWLVTDVDGYTDDNGITFTYQVTFTTKQTENWAVLEFFRNDHGVAYAIAPTNVATLRGTLYANSINSSVNGLLLIGAYKLVNFPSVYGVPATGLPFPPNY